MHGMAFLPCKAYGENDGASAGSSFTTNKTINKDFRLEVCTGL